MDEVNSISASAWSALECALNEALVITSGLEVDDDVQRSLRRLSPPMVGVAAQLSRGCERNQLEANLRQQLITWFVSKVESIRGSAPHNDRATAALNRTVAESRRLILVMSAVVPVEIMNHSISPDSARVRAPFEAVLHRSVSRGLVGCSQQLAPSRCHCFVREINESLEDLRGRGSVAAEDAASMVSTLSFALRSLCSSLSESTMLTTKCVLEPLQDLGAASVARDVVDELRAGTQGSDLLGLFRRRLTGETAIFRCLFPDHFATPANVHCFRDKVARTALVPHLQAIICDSATGLLALLREQRHAEAQLMFTVLSLIPDSEGTLAMAQQFRAFVAETCQRVVDEFSAAAENAGSPIAIDAAAVTSVSAFMNIQRSISLLVEARFDRSVCFTASFHEVFGSIANSSIASHKGRRVKFVALLALFVDSWLRGDVKDLSIDDPGTVLAVTDGVLSLLTHADDKDVFVDCARARLASRVLSGALLDVDVERSFLGRLRAAIGRSATHSMENMLNDVEAARGLNERFRCDSAAESLQVQFDVQVFRASDWPTSSAGASPGTSLRLPKAMIDCIESFERFYLAGAAVRKRLTWLHHFSSCSVAVSFPRGAKELNCSLLQALVLLAVDAAGALSAADLAKELGLEPSQINATLFSLHKQVAKLPLLLLIAAGAAGDAEPRDESYTINREFTSAMRRIKVPAPRASQTRPTIVDADGAEGAAVVQQRSHATDACIVKVMKSRRALSFSDLHAAVAEHLSRLFPASTKLVKSRVEDLIARSYLQRSGKDSNVLEYLA